MPAGIVEQQHDALLGTGADRRNDWLRPFYERLRAAGKPAKLALIAAMRKLLCAIYSVAKNRKPFTFAIPVATEQAREA